MPVPGGLRVQYDLHDVLDPDGGGSGAHTRGHLRRSLPYHGHSHTRGRHAR